MFIEYQSRDNPSGITVSKADWFVTYFKEFDELWYIRTEELKQLVRTNEFPEAKFSGDDGSDTRGYLIPRYQYKNKFKVRIVPKKWLN